MDHSPSAHRTPGLVRTPLAPVRRTAPALAAAALLGAAALLTGCAGGDLGKDPAAVLVADSVTTGISAHIPTVATVAWETSDAVVSYVEYGPDTDYGYTTPAPDAPGTAHTAALMDIPELSTWHFRVVAVAEDGTEVRTEDATVETDRCAGDVPDIEILDDDGAAWGTHTLASLGWSVESDGNGAIIVNDAGEIVWCWTDGELRFVPWAAPSLDGKSVHILSASSGGDFGSRFYTVALDGSALDERLVPRAHHDVALVGAHGVQYAYLSSMVGTVGGDLVLADLIVEVLDDGSERTFWNAFNHLPVERHAGWENRNDEGAADWTHGNGLHYEPASDSYVLSTYFLNTLFRIDRPSGGDIVWQLGGGTSDFTFVGDPGFERQHGPEVHGDTVYVFDNGGDDGSRGVSYTLDEGAGTATLDWQWSSPEGSVVGVLGDIDLVEDDQLLTGWGDLGQVAVTGRDGTLHWRMDAEPTAVIGKAHRLDGLFP
jgi:hypothetical protein